MLKFKFFKRLRVIFLSKKGDFCELVKKQDWSEIQFPSASDRKQETGFVLVTLILAVGVIGLSVVAFAAHTLKDSDVNLKRPRFCS